MKKALAIVLGLLVIVAAGARAVPSFLIDRIVDQAGLSIEAEGGELRYDRVERSERLLSTGRRYHALTITRPGAPLLTAESLDVNVPAWDWRQADWRSDSLVRVEQPGEWILTATELAAKTTIGFSGQLDGLDVRAPTVEIINPASAVAIVAAKPFVDYKRTGSPAGGTLFTASADRVESPQLEIVFDQVRLDARVDPPWPVEPTQRTVESWRIAGGVVTIDGAQAALPAGGQVNLTAAFNVNEALQPVGEGQIRVDEYEKVIDLLIERSIIAQDAAVMIKLTVGLVAAADEDGDPTALTLPLRIDGGQIFAGEFLLGQMPPVVWPDG